MKCKLESCNEEVVQPVPLKGRPKVFHSDACRVLYWNAHSRPEPQARHSIADVNEAERTGFCKKCDRRVKVFRIGDKYDDGRPRVRWVCSNRVAQAPSRQRYNRSGKRRMTAMRSRYQLSQEQLDRALALNTGKCHICERSAEETRMVLDHCHEGGHVRGWLCDACNLMLGNASDDSSRLRAAADYLERAS